MLVLKDSKFKCIVEVSFANWDNTALQNEIIKSRINATYK